MLSLEDTLSELGDFSTLWFRELYLEIAKCPQFPTDTSLPWILVEHCLQTTSSLGLHPLMSIVDIYNDAANYSLYQLKRQILFDEAEAEGKLCFDQLVYILADQMYASCTSEALHKLNDSWDDGAHDTARVGSSVTKSSSKGRATKATHPSLEWVADAKRVEVFGESHNLTFLLGQHVHLKIMKDLEKWFSRVEASDATSMLDSWESLQLLRSAHALLSTLVPVDEFDDMMQDVDAQGSIPDAQAEALPPIVIPSRIQAYASQILLLDLCQHFSYSVFSCCFQRVPLPFELQLCVPNIYADDVLAENVRLVSRVTSSAASHACQKTEVADVNYRGLFG